MLFDEVTSALDPETVGEVLTVIRELVRRGHDLRAGHPRDAFRRGDQRQVYFTEAGLIVEHGPAEQHLRRPDQRAHAGIFAPRPGRSGRRPVANGDPFLLSNISRYSLSV
jgi:polar amino acid transport system ATP-binding protein